MTEDDDAGATPVAVISESLARRRLRGVDPIGLHMTIGPPEPAYTIVGVVADVRHASLAEAPMEAVYTTSAQWAYADEGMSLVVRTRGEPGTFATSIRQAIWAADPGQPVARIATMDELLARSSASRRFALTLFRSFGLAALILAAVGLWAILANRVAERTREIGVRAALGATRGMLVLGVVRHGMAIAGAGILIGLAASVAASRALSSLLFGVSRLDPPTYLFASLLLGVVAIAACAIPAWRAARVDPVRALRME